jgi:hypothetical protein
MRIHTWLSFFRGPGHEPYAETLTITVSGGKVNRWPRSADANSLMISVPTRCSPRAVMRRSVEFSGMGAAREVPAAGSLPSPQEPSQSRAAHQAPPIYHEALRSSTSRRDLVPWLGVFGMGVGGPAGFSPLDHTPTVIRDHIPTVIQTR